MQTHVQDTDGQNLALATSEEEVDRLNAEFYSAIRYPWPPHYFEQLADRRFWAAMLDQELGRAGSPVLPPGSGRVWVAGCGTNQAVITALMFPDARVVGSDVSTGSLEVAERNARQLGIGNLELRAESIHQAPYAEEFDYIICTGVIHHTADPAAALARLSAALRPAGVMQLMVYNRYRRTLSTAFQKAVRTLLGKGGFAHQEEFALARRFVHHYGGGGTLAPWFESLRELPDAALADILVQPVEHSYTVESLGAMAHGAGLELLAPCPNPLDAGDGTLDWEMELGDPELQRAYDALPDVRRWQVTNLLQLGHSPMLWFYLQRGTSPVARRTTRELCEAFVDSRCMKQRTTRRMYMSTPEGAYRPSERELPYPVWRGEGDARRVYEALDSNLPLRATLERVGIDPGDLRAVNRLRARLASSVFPFLKAHPRPG
ncbi:MAG TPA: methyltransferase domain-containing protein [Longimicrobium sp.]|nr:methyltransferase domain-containing protein [Longimicrobium sp.]